MSKGSGDETWRRMDTANTSRRYLVNFAQITHTNIQLHLTVTLKMVACQMNSPVDTLIPVNFVYK
jgi:hypothetical protein